MALASFSRQKRHREALVAFVRALRMPLVETKARFMTDSCRPLEPNFSTIGVHRPNPSKILITCEHAGNELPPSVHWGPEDSEKKLSFQHWAFDPGAKEFAQELAEQLDSPAVLSRFSRLFVDLNRPVASPTLIREYCDGQRVELNTNITVAERYRRILQYYLPFHDEVELVGRASKSRTAIAVHTFTKQYEGNQRGFEIGVLSSTGNQELCLLITKALLANGFSAKVNKPWSGQHGFMHTVDMYTYNGFPGHRQSLMFEFRNDVCQVAAWRKAVLRVIVPMLQQHEHEFCQRNR